ncbi:copper resistance CopC/CopD family protein [Streptomyces albogriseolus]|uniref:copper resistance CopC/CopD family protein n=1 Tax=Streptomyces albogriseolus TaxID=1887 RepID=UPI00225C0210|nr:copper resistance protein CopC [Streptomyces viridodiastaticus]MCX4621063.1 copper resistance protein CopC/CopD [Streptomyces viridodiastaticus]
MLLGTLLILLLAGAAPASAHAALRASDPEDGSVVRTAPTHITLTFTESVGLLEDSFRIYGPDNRRVPMEEPEHAAGAADTARAALPRDLAEGTYTVAWRVVSADSHPVSGAFTFSIGKPSPTPPAAPQDHAEHPVTKSLYDTGRYLAYLAAALLIGTAAFAALCRPPDTGPLRAPLLFGWWTLLVTTAALLILRAPYEKGTSPGTALDVSAFPDTVSGRPGMALLSRLALLLTAALLLPVLRDRSPRTRVTAGAAFSVALALTWASAEHASAGIQVPVAMTSSVLHLLAMACWLGGLAALLLTLHRARTPPPYDTVARFSRVAFTSVTVLVVTGAYQSWRGLGSWSALTQTAYGRTLAVKLAATVFLLSAAALSRRWTALLARPAAAGERVPALVGAPGPPPAPRTTHMTTVEPETLHRRALRRSVLAEVVVAVAVLLVTTVLTGTLPSRAEAEAAKAPEPQVAGLPGAQALTVPYDTGTPGGSGTVQLTMDPGRVGENGLQAVVFGPQGALTFVPELRVTFTLPSKDVGPIDAGLTDRGGYWATNDLTLPLEGAWTMKLTVRVSDIDQVTVERGVRITR